MLHLCCELLHLLPQACIFLLETPLHIVLQRFGLPLSFIGIFCFFFGALDLLAVLGVAILKILRTCTTGLEGEFHVTDLLGQVFDLVKLRSSLSISLLPLPLELILHFYS